MFIRFLPHIHNSDTPYICIQIFNNAGWHFNNILSPEEISLKLKTFAHSEFAAEKFSSVESIKNNIKNKIDLFGRGHKYEKVEIDHTFPNYLINNKEKFKKFIIWISEPFLRFIINID